MFAVVALVMVVKWTAGMFPAHPIIATIVVLAALGGGGSARR
jgi:hypothetical protein